MGKPADWYDLVSDRPGHDLRYAIDSTKLRSRDRLERRSTRTSAPAWRRPSHWYRDHEDWWRAAKERTESTYQRLGR